MALTRDVMNSTEKSIVDHGMKASLVLGHEWEPISADWYIRWKAYADAVINTTMADSELQDLLPGPIDNTSLQSDYEGELRPGLVEGENYVLMTRKATDFLFERYKGGPRFVREVINVGTSHSPVCQINLFRVRVEAYLTRSNQPFICEKTNSNEDRYKVLFFPKNTEYKTVVERLMAEFKLNVYTSAVRCWFRLTDGEDDGGGCAIDTSSVAAVSPPVAPTSTTSAVATVAAVAEVSATQTLSSCVCVASSGEEADEGDQVSEGGAVGAVGGGGGGGGGGDAMELKRARMGRLFTTDVTDVVDGWKYGRHVTSTMTVQELQGNQPCLEIMMEDAGVRKPAWKDWPRADLMEMWKKALRVGDVLDAKDSSGSWFPGLVTNVQKDGSIGIHYKGWSAEFDEVIPADKQRDSRLAPLYTESLDRREWAVGDQVEIKASTPADKPVWIPAEIRQVDAGADRVQVEFLIKERDAALTKFDVLIPAPPPPPVVATATATAATSTAGAGTGAVPTAAVANIHMESNDDDDDDAKKASVSAAVVRGEVPPAGTIYKWYGLLDEEICCIYTHTKRPVAPTAAKLTSATTATSSSTKTGGGVGSRTGIGSSITDLLSRPFQNRYTSDYSNSSTEKHVKGATEVAGAVGLQNLGNTCFMNSILQCLSNTQLLTEFFVDDRYKTQINFDNPLGHGGKLAAQYAKLVKDAWSHNYSKLIPREFKVTIGEFRPQFAGYDQQDSQEFLGFLLDGLHEDLNRVLKKPHVSKIESKGRDDGIIADESWRRFLLRNDSAVVDSCFGQLKSHVTCTNCGYESVTFDEYSSLSLPMPVKNTRVVDVTVQRLPLGSPPVEVALELDITATMMELEKELTAKLREYGVLQTTTNKHSDSNNISTNDSSDSAAATHMDVDTGSGSDNSYEMVQTTTSTHTSSTTAAAAVIGTGTGNSVCVDDETYVKVNNANDCSSISANGGGAISKGLEDEAAIAAPCFHFATLFSHRPSSVFKNYHRAEDRSASVQGFVGKTSTLMAFQLEHKAPEFRSTYTGNKRVEYDPSDSLSAHVAIDIAMGSKTKMHYGNYERIELTGFPLRIAIPKECTNRYVLEQIWMLMQRFLKEDSSYVHTQPQQEQEQEQEQKPPEGRPYTVVVTNAYASTVKRTVDFNHDVFEVPAGGTDMLVVLWPSNFDDHIDNDQINLVIKQPAQSEQMKTAAVAEASSQEAQSTGTKLNIYQCFDKFSEREKLAETETLYCSRCKQHLPPIKKMDIWAAPDILILQLKRFQYIPGQYFVHREKISDLVDFPIEGLDLTKYVIGPSPPEQQQQQQQQQTNGMPMAATTGLAAGSSSSGGSDSCVPPIYDCYAISHHMGGLGGGHYTATCKNFLNGKWYHFNDSNVSACADPQRAVDGTAYVLFYKRRTPSLKWAGIVPSAVPMPDEED